ncbi:hypothetical protein BO70DRAFT_413661 [Aspergillus heteromorphus CBS 117.55]|uniref:LysM domain-containing protein n=1 Tax=Aspergillus heteromorphus CBS 117.55 TaxID=1448321 RepID=A0A317VIF3_9EURO|nr:uncharacterized protein BO70DRAFT_413661 [Aspergillus heteromorphus CBS 117.55]PWY73001.1 hypothetical protein BO70DRAFT_413661 [Aspergillus heteromorphus CBS 117.55]
MVRTSVVASLLLAGSNFAAGYLVDPPGTAFPGADPDCSEWVAYTDGLTCAKIEEEYGISELEFLSWNPYLVLVYTSCDVAAGFDYCVDVDFLTWGTSTSSSSSSVSTSSGDGVTTPSAIQTGMTSTCDKFYLVASGDSCSTIAADAGISLADFYAWNPAVGDTCADLWADDYVCIDVIGFVASTTAAVTTTIAISSTTTSAGDGITTPSPIQTGMSSTCDKFYLVESGDSCSTIASDAGISLADFYAWNPAVGDTCADLWADDYVCIDVIGYVASTTTVASTATTTSAGNGITTPTPYESGMVDDCDKFYLVASGDSCSSIATAEDVTQAEIEEWNPTVGSSCSSLWLDYYICVGVL